MACSGLLCVVEYQILAMFLHDLVAKVLVFCSVGKSHGFLFLNGDS